MLGNWKIFSRILLVFLFLFGCNSFADAGNPFRHPDNSVDIVISPLRYRLSAGTPQSKDCRSKFFSKGIIQCPMLRVFRNRFVPCENAFHGVIDWGGSKSISASRIWSRCDNSIFSAFSKVSPAALLVATIMKSVKFRPRKAAALCQRCLIS